MCCRFNDYNKINWYLKVIGLDGTLNAGESVIFEIMFIISDLTYFVGHTFIVPLNYFPQNNFCDAEAL